MSYIWNYLLELITFRLTCNVTFWKHKNIKGNWFTWTIYSVQAVPVSLSACNSDFGLDFLFRSLLFYFGL